MNRVFVVTKALRDVDGLMALLQDLLAPSEGRITIVHVTDPAHRLPEPPLDTFTDAVNKVNAFVADWAKYAQRDVRPLHMDYLPLTPWNGSPGDDCATALAVMSVLREETGPFAVLLDLLDGDQDLFAREETALYRLLLGQGLEDHCLLYANWPESDTCRRWLRDNAPGMSTEIFKREYLCRARAIYVPFKKALLAALSAGGNARAPGDVPLPEDWKPVHFRHLDGFALDVAGPAKLFVSKGAPSKGWSWQLMLGPNRKVAASGNVPAHEFGDAARAALEKSIKYLADLSGLALDARADIGAILARSGRPPDGRD